MPNKQSIVLAIVVCIFGFIISVGGFNVVDVNGDTTPIGYNVGITGIGIFFLGFVCLFIFEIGTMLSSKFG